MASRSMCTAKQSPTAVTGAPVGGQQHPGAVDRDMPPRITQHREDLRRLGADQPLLLDTFGAPSHPATPSDISLSVRAVLLLVLVRCCRMLDRASGADPADPAAADDDHVRRSGRGQRSVGHYRPRPEHAIEGSPTT